MADNLYVISGTAEYVFSESGAAVIVSPSQTIPESVRQQYSVAAAPSEPARRAGVRVLYNNKDITVDLAPWLLAVEFTDGLEKADDLQITLWDDGRWRSSWAPAHGAKLEVHIYVVEKQASARMTCGTFTIDEVEYSGPPSVVTLRAVSAYVTTALRKEKKTRAWEAVSLRQIAETIAAKAGLALYYSARNNPTYARMDQKSRSDLDFLVSLAEREGLRVKTAHGQLIVYSGSEQEATPAVDTFSWGDMRTVSYQFGGSITSAYRRAVIKYRKPHEKKLLEFVYTLVDAPATGQTLRLSERCESLAEAERVARNRIVAANRHINTGYLGIVGDTTIEVGLNIGASGFGTVIDGDYAIEEARHALWPYTTFLTLRKL